MEGSFPNYTSYLLFVDLASLSLYLLLYSLYLFYPSVLRLPLCFTFCTSLSFFSSLSLSVFIGLSFLFSHPLSLSLSLSFFFFSSPLFELCLLFLSFSLFSLFFSLFSLSLSRSQSLSLSLLFTQYRFLTPRGQTYTPYFSAFTSFPARLLRSIWSISSASPRCACRDPHWRLWNLSSFPETSANWSVRLWWCWISPTECTYDHDQGLGIICSMVRGWILVDSRPILTHVGGWSSPH